MVRSSPARVGALLALLVIVCCATWFVLRETPTSSSPHAYIDASSFAPARSEPVPNVDTFLAAPADSTAERVSGAVANSARAGTLTGVVRVREDSSPVVGVRVTVSAHGEARTATTDDTGAYTVSWDSPVTVRYVSVRAGASTASALRHVAWRIGSGDVRHADVWVTRGRSLAGRVVDGAGNGLAGARVRVWHGNHYSPANPIDREVTSGADGAFRVEHLRDFAIDATLDGWACLRGLRGTIAPGADVEALTVVLVRACDITGRVVDGQGRGVVGAEVTIEASGQSSSTDVTSAAGVSTFYAVNHVVKTDANGAFGFGPVPTQRWDVRVRHSEHIERFAQIEPGSANEIVLESGSVLRGRVLSLAGDPVAGARVRVVGRIGNERWCTTDFDGRFDARAFEPNEHSFVAVRADGYSLGHVQPIDAERIRPSVLEIRLAPASPIAGRVVDETGAPLADALVVSSGPHVLEYDAIFERQPTVEHFLDDDERRTDADGRFVFERAYAGTHELRISPSEAPDLVHVERLVAGSGETTIVVDRKALEHVVFAGRVIDAVTRAPVRDFRVSVWRPNGEHGMRGSSYDVADDEGRFRFPGTLPGRCRFDVKAHGYAQWSTGDIELADGVSEHVVELLQVRSIELVLRWKDRPSRNAGATVTFEDARGRTLFVESGPQSTTSHLDVWGPPQRASGLPASLVRMRVRAQAQGIPAQDIELDLRTPLTEPVVIELDGSNADEPSAWSIAFAATEDATLLGLAQNDLARVRMQAVTSVDAELFATDGERLARVRIESTGERAWKTTIEYTGEGDPVVAPADFPSVDVRLPRRLASVRVSGAGLVTRTWKPVSEAEAHGGHVIVLLSRDK